MENKNEDKERDVAKTVVSSLGFDCGVLEDGAVGVAETKRRCREDTLTGNFIGYITEKVSDPDVRRTMIEYVEMIYGSQLQAGKLTAAYMKMGARREEQGRYANYEAARLVWLVNTAKEMLYKAANGSGKEDAKSLREDITYIRRRIAEMQLDIEKDVESAVSHSTLRYIDDSKVDLPKFIALMVERDLRENGSVDDALAKYVKAFASFKAKVEEWSKVADNRMVKFSDENARAIIRDFSFILHGIGEVFA